MHQRPADRHIVTFASRRAVSKWRTTFCLAAASFVYDEDGITAANVAWPYCHDEDDET